MDEYNFTEKLKDYFHNKNGSLNLSIPTENELNEIVNFYKSLLEKKWSIENIKGYQNNYIQLVIREKMNYLRKGHIQIINNRLHKLNNYLKKIK